jgi:outer membrane protein OmpA-like peptidoglycan-associated protein
MTQHRNLIFIGVGAAIVTLLAIWGLLGRPMTLPRVASKPTSVTVPPNPATAPRRSAEPGPSGQASPETSNPIAPTFDVARLEQEGNSVFAGRAQPGARVTIHANGKPIATATAGRNGEWVAIVEQPLPGGSYEFSLVAQAPDGSTPVEGPQKIMAHLKQVAPVAPGKPIFAARPAAPDSPAPPASPAPTKTAVAPLSGGAVRPVEAPSPAVLAEQTARFKNLEKMIAAAREGLPPLPSTAGDSTPLPITFVYKEAILTAQGERAAALLAEYLKVKDARRATLTGHADERGTEAFNYQLSRERLDLIARYLKEHGYEGDLILEPKGKREPFSGIERERYTRDDLYLLDRRVELKGVR